MLHILIYCIAYLIVLPTNIPRYQCMEATPSLACANKCVFCWRHHKNPVGREWRWKEDPPEQVIMTKYIEVGWMSCLFLFAQVITLC